jgi:carboxymethylenebutenolidase
MQKEDLGNGCDYLLVSGILLYYNIFIYLIGDNLMKKRFYLLTAILVFSVTMVLAGTVFAGNITEETVSFRSGNDTVSAFLARPTGNGSYPALVVIHEWWGLNDWVKNNAREFAEKGYVAVAVDLYRGKAAEDPGLAHELSRALPADRAVQDMKAAIDYLRMQPFVTDSKIGSIGWCMGGGYSLQLALHADTAATVIAYGRLVTDAGEIGKIDSPVLGIFGALDRGIPVDDVRAFENALNRQGKPNEIVVYEGVGHAFMNPGNSRGYNEDATKMAWEKIYGFLDDTLK